MRFADNPLVFLVKTTWRHSDRRSRVVLYVVLFGIANTLSLLQPLLIGHVLNIIQADGVSWGNLPRIFGWLSGIVGLIIAFWMFHGPARVLENINAFRVRASCKKELLEGVMDLPAEWHANHHSGDTIDKIEKGTGALFAFSSDSFEIIEAVVRLIGSLAALFYFNLPGAFVAIFIVVLAVTTSLRFDRVLIRQYRELNRAENGISEKIFDVLSNITTVIVLRAEKLVGGAIREKIMAPYALFRRNSQVNEVKWFLVNAISTTMVVIVLGSYIWLELRAGAPILVGSLYALYGYLDKIGGTFFRFTGTYAKIIRQRTAVANAEEVAKDFRERPALETAPSGLWNTMRIENLHFSYHAEEGAVRHLDIAALELRRGERVALIGESGGGKTTFLKVMRDLYHPRSLRLSVDGEEVPGGFRTISDRVALVPQDPELFTSTILENITLGVPHDMAYVRRFADMAVFTRIAERLPHGWQSSIVEKGVNLSGGERQRLALARALMASEDKDILLLDEPTSSVDPANELTIYRNIFGAFKGKTIIASVHRLHLLSFFDTVYFFRAGRIIGKGMFTELLRTSPEFREMWQKYRAAHREEAEASL